MVYDLETGELVSKDQLHQAKDAINEEDEDEDDDDDGEDDDGT